MIFVLGADKTRVSKMVLLVKGSLILLLQKEELKIDDEKRNRYFPLILDEKDAERINTKLQKSLRSYFGIDMDKHYPKLYKQLLQVRKKSRSFIYLFIYSGCEPRTHRKAKFITVLARHP